jgi:hypothetical protein
LLEEVGEVVRHKSAPNNLRQERLLHSSSALPPTEVRFYELSKNDALADGLYFIIIERHYMRTLDWLSDYPGEASERCIRRSGRTLGLAPPHVEFVQEMRPHNHRVDKGPEPGQQWHKARMTKAKD